MAGRGRLRFDVLSVGDLVKLGRYWSYLLEDIKMYMQQRSEIHWIKQLEMFVLFDGDY